MLIVEQRSLSAVLGALAVALVVGAGPYLASLAAAERAMAQRCDFVTADLTTRQPRYFALTFWRG